MGHPQHAPLDARTSRGGAIEATGLLTAAACFVAALAIASMLTVSPSLLTHWKIQYATSGGTSFEKLHPATYLCIIALGLLALRSGNPIAGLIRILTASKATIVYLICWLLLLVQTMMLERPFTGIIDTFLLPVLFVLAIWQLPQYRRVLALVVHGFILLNVVIGYYEYFGGGRIIPLTLGKVLVIGEWRSAALLGHPLIASGLVAAYTLALTLNPRACPVPQLRLPLIAFCLGSLMVFGGRTALVTTLGIMGLAGAVSMLNLTRGARISLPALIAAIILAFAAVAGIFALFDLGLFDKMLLRFSSDKGSTLARYATWQLLSYFDWSEILFGPTIARANALQNQLGLDYGIENFWISCIVQFGLLHTTLITAGLALFIGRLLRNSHPSAIAVVILMAVIAASSVSFSSKNVQLAQFIVIITVLLAKTASPAASVSRPVPTYMQPYRARRIA